MSSNGTAVSVQNLHFAYEDEIVLEDVSFGLEEKDFLGVVGPNGGGKTTLLKILLGLLEPDSGLVQIFGQPPRLASRLIGYVPQQINLDKDFPINVEDVVLLGRLGEAPPVGRYRPLDRELAQNALAKVDLAEFRNRRFGDLSGGQRQRVLIARALVGGPRMLIMDEPTANVDSRSQKRIYDLLSALNEECAIILVSHDLSVVSQQVKRVACLNRRLVMHPTSQMTGAMIEEMYHVPMKLVDHGQIV